MTKIKITCPITWWEQCEWIWDNCRDYKDVTNWPAHQIGMDDIFFIISDEDAVVFRLLFANRLTRL